MQGTRWPETAIRSAIEAAAGFLRCCSWTNSGVASSVTELSGIQFGSALAITNKEHTHCNPAQKSQRVSLYFLMKPISTNMPVD